MHLHYPWESDTFCSVFQPSDSEAIDGKEIVYVAGGMGDPFVIRKGHVTSVTTDGFRSVEFVVNGQTLYLEALAAVFVNP